MQACIKSQALLYLYPWFGWWKRSMFERFIIKIVLYHFSQNILKWEFAFFWWFLTSFCWQSNKMSKSFEEWRIQTFSKDSDKNLLSTYLTAKVDRESVLESDLLIFMKLKINFIVCLTTIPYFSLKIRSDNIENL